MNADKKDGAIGVNLRSSVAIWFLLQLLASHLTSAALAAEQTKSPNGQSPLAPLSTSLRH
ncbi:exported hypothetical protein [Candidatus Sulfopaludibacter sp. SbA4]|nr:exported hypothetical protein [Candidatus Sulfopaludibacter sp. SbA4]